MRAPVLPRVVSRRLRLLSYAVLAILLAIAALVAAATLPVLFGYHTYVVNGSSMEPSLKRGSVAVAQKTSPFALEVGDVIVRKETQDGPAVLHRIARIIDDDTGRLLYTQGDANRTADPEPVMLLGSGDKVIYSIPYAGYILNFGSSTFGRILLLGAPLTLLAAITLYEKSPSWRRRQRSDSPPSSDEIREALVGLSLVPRKPTFLPVNRPIRVSLIDLSDFLGLMRAARTLSDLPGGLHASIISFKNGTVVLEVAFGVPLLADEIVDALQAGTGYHIVIEEDRPDIPQLRLRFVDPAGQLQLDRAA